MTKKKISLNEKLDKILKNQDKILDNEAKILGEEKKLEKMEAQDLKNDAENLKTEEEALKELSNLEKELKKSISSPLKTVTKRDFAKGFVGAFIGVMGHFAFYKAQDIAEKLDIVQATLLYGVSFLMIIVMLYYTGFRQIKKRIVLKFLPFRAVTLYLVAIFAVLLVNALFGTLPKPFDYLELYKLVGASIVLAVLGAGTADLIGRNE